MNLICPPLSNHPSLFAIQPPSSALSYFQLYHPVIEQKYHLDTLKKRLRLAGKVSFRSSILLQWLGSCAGFCSWKLQGSFRGYQCITRNGRNSWSSVLFLSRHNDVRIRSLLYSLLLSASVETISFCLPHCKILSVMSYILMGWFREMHIY